MQFSRSFFTILALGSLMSVSAKAEVDTKLFVAGGAGVLAAFLHARTIDTKKTDVLNQTLNAGSTVVQKAVNFVKNNAVSATVAGVVAFAAYHNKNIHHTHAAHHLLHFLKHSEHSVAAKI